MRLLPFLLIALFLSVGVAQNPSTASPKSQSAPVESMQRKLDRIQQNGGRAKPVPQTTTFTEEEVNAYLASGRVKLPEGVESVRWSGTSGVISGVSRVNFDQVNASRRTSNPLLSMFRGSHDVAATAHASGSGGQGIVHVDSVALDGVEVPQFVLQLYVDRYLKPKYPNLGIDSRFQLPDHIDTATVGNHTLTVTQK